MLLLFQYSILKKTRCLQEFERTPSWHRSNCMHYILMHLFVYSRTSVCPCPWFLAKPSENKTQICKKNLAGQFCNSRGMHMLLDTACVSRTSYILLQTTKCSLNLNVLIWRSLLNMQAYTTATRAAVRPLERFAKQCLHPLNPFKDGEINNPFAAGIIPSCFQEEVHNFFFFLKPNSSLTVLFPLRWSSQNQSFNKD